MLIVLLALAFQLTVMLIIFSTLTFQFSIVFNVFLPLLLKSLFMSFANCVQGEKITFCLYVLQNIVKAFFLCVVQFPSPCFLETKGYRLRDPIALMRINSSKTVKELHLIRKITLIFQDVRQYLVGIILCPCDVLEDFSR